VSLTSQLDGGVLGAWFADRFPGTGRLAESITTAADRVEAVNPAEHAMIGDAFRARLALLVDGAPPYRALGGLVRSGLVSREWAHRTTATFPSHRGLAPDRAARALDVRPTPAGWVEVAGPEGPPPTRHEPVLTEFFGRLVGYLDEYAPPGVLGTPNIEAGFARVCLLLAGWAAPERPAELADLQARDDYAVDDLWDLAGQPVVAELLDLAERLRRHHDGDPGDRPLETWRGWGRDYAEPAGPAALKRADTGQAGTGLPAGVWGVSAPDVVRDWADADLLVGSRLLGVETEVRADRVSRGLWRLAACAWLDTADRYRVRSVGLYLARHGLHVTWDGPTFVQALLGSTRGVEAARREFLGVARKVITAEGARPPTRRGIPWRGRG
jgi:hypothetical protein